MSQWGLVVLGGSVSAVVGCRAVVPCDLIQILRMGPTLVLRVLWHMEGAVLQGVVPMLTAPLVGQVVLLRRMVGLRPWVLRGLGAHITMGIGGGILSRPIEAVGAAVLAQLGLARIWAMVGTGGGQ